MTKAIPIQERPVSGAMAAAIDDPEVIPNEFGWFFPSAKDPSRPVSAATLYSFSGVSGSEV